MIDCACLAIEKAFQAFAHDVADAKKMPREGCPANVNVNKDFKLRQIESDVDARPRHRRQDARCLLHRKHDHPQ
jgi:hypothetical protein